MKKLIFICGPNGVGKSTTCLTLNRQLINSALVESEWCRQINPYDFTDEVLCINKQNITSLLSNYLASTKIDYIIWTYGFHGHRKKIFDDVMNDLQKYEYEFIPFILTCDIIENQKRMIQEERDEIRIRRAIEESREVYDNIHYTKIDTTKLSVDEVVEEIVRRIKVQ